MCSSLSSLQHMAVCHVMLLDNEAASWHTCESLLTGGSLHGVKGQHTLQQPEGAPVCLDKVLLKVYAGLLAHVHQEAACLLVAYLVHMTLVLNCEWLFAVACCLQCRADTAC